MAIAEYQHVTSAFDVTQSGQRSIYYLQGNGVNQYMATSANVDMSSVFAAAMVAGLEQVGVSNALIWHRDGNGDASIGVTSWGHDVSRWRASSREGGVLSFAYASATLPTRSVVSALADRSAADFLRIRINGNQADEQNPGFTANMGNVRLSIFATSAGSAHSPARWFGHTFCAMTAAELARTEAYTAYLTGETLA